MNRLPCHIVRDLLPLYADGLTAADTAGDLRAHLETCPECAAALRAMREGEERASQASQKRDVAYLKGLRRRTGMIVLGVVLLAALLLAAIPAVRIFLIGGEDTGAVYRVTSQNGIIMVRGSLTGSAEAVADAHAEITDGTAVIHVRSVLVGLRRSGEFTLTLKDPGIRRVVTSDGRVLWEDGVTISFEAGKVYAACTPYIGDASAVHRYLDALDLREQLVTNVTMPVGGPAPEYGYTIALQTAAKPYGLTVRVGIGGKTEPSELDCADLLPRLGTAILAGIANLGEVTFDYGVNESFRWTVADADALLGYPVKECAASAGAFQRMLTQLGITP